MEKSGIGILPMEQRNIPNATPPTHPSARRSCHMAGESLTPILRPTPHGYRVLRSDQYNVTLFDFFHLKEVEFGRQKPLQPDHGAALGHREAAIPNMDAPTLHRILNPLIAAVWLINGLFAKVFNLVPRHREIVAEIIGREQADWMTVAIGGGEVLMAAWILSGRWPRICATIQIALVAVMNVLEIVLVPELLLWGRMNIVFAFGFLVIVFYNGFRRSPHADAS